MKSQKKCPACEQVVSSCQCEKEGGSCEYCQTNLVDVASVESIISGGVFKGATFSGSAFGENKLTQVINTKEQTCSCKKISEKIVKGEVKITQDEEDGKQQVSNALSLISGGDYQEAKFTENAFTKNILHQTIGQENKKTCRACESEVENCSCKKNAQCEYCQNKSIDKKTCYCEKIQTKELTSSENQQSLLASQLKEKQTLTSEETNQIKEYLKTKDDWYKNRKKNKAVVNLINDLCQVRRKITQLQIELDNLQNQQTQIIQQQPFGFPSSSK